VALVASELKGESPDWETAALMIAEAQFDPNLRLPHATSSAKARRIYADQLEAIKRKLSSRDLHYADALALYLDAGLPTGLRPIEWTHARLVTTCSSAVLIVCNAKNSEQRAHGRFRRLVWKLPDATAEIDAIDRYLAEVRCRLAGVPWGARREMMEDFNRALGDTLRRVQRDIWAERSPQIVLYTTRHEFASQAKARLSQQEVAAILGHLSDATATRHYAQPPRGGRKHPSFILPSAHVRDLLRVQKRLKDWRRSLNNHGGPRVAR
jgi:hypothetical protein